ncbi:MAG: CsgG/HfaB family protein [Acidobacteriota bacterium]|nr:CsgG/HfaB family protein [Acidobacteriota bacterium]MDH3522447.1 CsgG/HfaB family protein [Acidobacteriota bacterium]
MKSPKSAAAARAAAVTVTLVQAWSYAASPGAAAAEPPGLAVVRFAAEPASEWWAFQGVDAARDLFAGELRASGKYRVLDRSELDARLLEHKLTGLAGEISPAAAVKAGRLLGVRYLVTATLTEFGGGGRRLLGLRAGRSFAAALDARLVDAESGDLLWADGGRTEATIERPAKRDEIDEPAYQARMYERLLAPIIRELARGLVAAQPQAAAAVPE